MEQSMTGKSSSQAISFAQVQGWIVDQLMCGWCTPGSRDGWSMYESSQQHLEDRTRCLCRSQAKHSAVTKGSWEGSSSLFPSRKVPSVTLPLSLESSIRAPAWAVSLGSGRLALLCGQSHSATLLYGKGACDSHPTHPSPSHLSPPPG